MFDRTLYEKILKDPLLYNSGARVFKKLDQGLMKAMGRSARISLFHAHQAAILEKELITWIKIWRQHETAPCKSCHILNKIRRITDKLLQLDPPKKSRKERIT